MATAYETNGSSQINPADIELIEILKGAATSTIYGSRGVNGSVLITTKGGSTSKAKANAGFQSGFAHDEALFLMDGIHRDKKGIFTSNEFQCLNALV